MKPIQNYDRFAAYLKPVIDFQLQKQTRNQFMPAHPVVVNRSSKDDRGKNLHNVTK